MRHIVLFEPDPSGHRMVFIRYIVEAMARREGLRATLITSPRGRAAPWPGEMNERLRPHLSLHVMDTPTRSGGRLPLPTKLDRQFGATRLLRSAVRHLSSDQPVDHVFVPFLDDYCLFPFAWQPRPFGAVPWSGIAIRPRFHLRAAGADVPSRPADRIEAWAYRRLLRDSSLHSLFSIDPYLPQSLVDDRITTVPDPADIAEQTVDRYWPAPPQDAVMLLVYGHIDHRKAIDRLLDIAVDPRMPQGLVVALVGAQAAGMEPVIRSPAAKQLRAQGRLLEVPRRVTEEEEAAAFARADIVWAYYPGSYCSSGAMVRAGQMGRALMATREGLVGHLTQRHGSGLTAPEGDDEAVLRQLSRLVADPELRSSLGEAGRRYFAGSTSAAFGEQIIDGLLAATRPARVAS